MKRAGAVLLLFAASALHAQTFPSKPLKIIVPFPPGGSADTSTRLLGEHMAKRLGQPVVIENRPGGSTVIGTQLAQRSAADGHTLLVVFPSFVIQPALRAHMPFDPMKDFRAVGQTISLPMVIAVHPSVAVSSLRELIELSKAKSGTLAYGTPGAGTTHHVQGEMFRLATGAHLTHAAFQGGAPAMTAILGGHIPMVYVNVNEVATYAKTGRIRALVVTTRERAETLPQVPTFRELGLPELESSNWSGLVVPAATPASAVAKLNAALVSVLRDAEVLEKFRAHELQAVPGTPEQFTAFLQAESLRYAKVVREAGIKAE